MRRFFHRLTYWLRRAKLERDLAEEIEIHRALRQERLEESGMAPAEASDASRRALGNVTLAREDVRDLWVFRWLDELARDLRHAIRLLRRSSGFTTVAVASLALGIGANTAIFTLVDAVVLKKLPVAQPERLVVLERVNLRGEPSNFSYPLFEAVRAPDRVFAGAFATLDGTYRLNLSRSGADADPIYVQPVSGEYFHVLGVQTVLGRPLAASDALARDEHVGVMSYALWQRRFAGDPSVVGRRIVVKGQSIAIVGVARARFYGVAVGHAPDLWVPLTMQPALSPPDLLTDPSVGWLRVMARLQPGATLEQARESLNVRLHGLKADPGPLSQSLRQVGAIAASPGSRGLADTRTQFSQQLWMLMAVVGVVLLIACANVANLLLARAAARRRETAIRLAIGAGRGRLVRQFLTESVLLAGIGGTLGLLLGSWGSHLLLALASDGSGQLSIDVAPDVRVLAFTLAISLGTVLVFGLAPANAAARQDVNASLKETIVPPRLAVPGLLVIAQVALSLLLLTGAGLFLQTLRNLRTLDLGFVPDEIVQIATRPDAAGYRREQLAALYRQLVDRLSAAPGIRSASIATSGFATGVARTCCIAIEGRLPEPGEERRVRTIGVSPEYFQTMGLPIVHGRPFTAGDLVPFPQSARVAIINEAMAQYYFGTEAAVGRRFGWGDPPAAKYPFEVVGVARNAVYGRLRDGSWPVIYFPGETGPHLIVRAGLPAGAIAATIRRELQAVDRSLEAEVATIPQLLNESVVLERLLATLSGFFGALATLLAGIGIYGLLSYAVARRTREIGIRIALGAQQKRVVRDIFGDTLSLLVPGVALGVCASLALTWLTASLLFGVAPRDVTSLAAAVLVLAATATLATALPARRAALVEPTIALRHE
jgi:predicted permease